MFSKRAASLPVVLVFLPLLLCAQSPAQQASLEADGQLAGNVASWIPVPAGEPEPDLAKPIAPVNRLRTSARSNSGIGNAREALPSFGSITSINSIFLEATTYDTGLTYASAFVLADVNGDGKPDLAITSCASADCTDGVINVLLGNGDGTFQAPASYGYGGRGGYYDTSVAAADVNGDGKLDLLVVDECVKKAECKDGQNGLVGVLLGNGDGTFQPVVTYSSGGSDPGSIAVADVNGDGKLDLVVANLCAGPGPGDCTKGGPIAVLLGNGDGTFKAPMTYKAGGVGPDSVVVGDVNGDGKLDLVVANRCFKAGPCDIGSTGPGSVTVLLGKGDGTFRPAVTYLSGGYIAVSVAIADVNGDHKPDVLVSNEVACGVYCNGAEQPFSSVGVLLGNGDGTFQTALDYDSGGGAGTLAVADVNADGKLDVLVSGATVAVLLGNGDGTFQPVVSYAEGGEGGNLAVADVNGDGKLDMVTVDSASLDFAVEGLVSVLPGNGDGTFQAAVIYGSGGSVGNNNYAYFFNTYSVGAADLNKDGKVDLFVPTGCFDVNCTNGGVSVSLGNGDGAFQTAVTYASGGYGVSSAAAGDLNGDGKPDVVVTNACVSNTDCANGVVGVLLGNGDGTFQPAVVYSTGGVEAVSVAIADVNRDGKLDLVVANACGNSSSCQAGSGTNPGPGTVSVLLGNGDGTFQAAASENSGGYGAYSVAVADVNGDGNPDLVVANVCNSGSTTGCTNGLVSVLLGKGNGKFQPAASYDSGGFDAVSVAVADVNNDSKLDLVVSNACVSNTACNPDVVTGNVGVLLGNGDGTFQPASSYVLPGIYFALAVADFNGDGNLDIAAGSDSLLLGNGDGTFQAPLGLGTLGHGLGAGDFNGDGRVDLAVSNGGMVVLLNVTTGFLPTTTTLTSSVNPSTEGKAVTFRAIVSATSGTPAGSVKFMNGTALLATVTLKAGKAEFTTSTLPVGTNPITAVYSGNSKYVGGISAEVNQVVKP